MVSQRDLRTGNVDCGETGVAVLTALHCCCYYYYYYYYTCLTASFPGQPG